jgi:hypothetical protein
LAQFAIKGTDLKILGLMERFSVTKIAAPSVPETSRVSETSWPCHQADDLLRIVVRLRNGWLSEAFRKRHELLE